MVSKMVLYIFLKKLQLQFIQKINKHSKKFKIIEPRYFKKKRSKSLRDGFSKNRKFKIEDN